MLKSTTKWFPGEHNDLADSLSRDFHLNTKTLTKLFHVHIPKQTPANLKTSNLSNTITSFIFSTLQKLPEKTQQQEAHKTSKIGHDTAEVGSSRNWESTETSSLISGNHEKEPFCSKHSLKQSEKELLSRSWQSPGLPDSLLHHGLQTIPGLTGTESLQGFYNNNLKAIKTMTQRRENKNNSNECNQKIT